MVMRTPSMLRFNMQRSYSHKLHRNSITENGVSNGGGGQQSSRVAAAANMWGGTRSNSSHPTESGSTPTALKYELQSADSRGVCGGELWL